MQSIMFRTMTYMSMNMCMDMKASASKHLLACQNAPRAIWSMTIIHGMMLSKSTKQPFQGIHKSLVAWLHMSKLTIHAHGKWTHIQPSACTHEHTWTHIKVKHTLSPALQPTGCIFFHTCILHL